MHFPVTRFLSAALLAAASLTAGAQTLLTQIPLGSFQGDYAYFDVAVNSATNRIYVPIQFADYSNSSQTAFSYNYFRVLVVDGATNQIVHNLPNFPSGSLYRGVAVDPVRNFTYVEMSNSVPAGNATQCTVSVIDGQTENTVKTIPLPAGDCGKMVVDPVTGKVYIGTTGGLKVIESEATGAVESLPAPVTFGSLTVSPYVHRLYFVLADESGYLGFFDTIKDQISEEKPISAGLTASVANPVVNPATGHIFGTEGVYNQSGFSQNVTVFDSSGSLLATVVPPVPNSDYVYPGTVTFVGMDVDPKTNRTFASASTEINAITGSALYVIDGTKNTVLSSTSVTLPEVIAGRVAVNPDTSTVYVTANTYVSGGPPWNGALYLNVYSEQ